jgi:hypothetical protein
MVRDYYPFDKEKTIEHFDFLYNKGYADSVIENLLDVKFCRHIYKFGKNKNKMCLTYIKNNKENDKIYVAGIML